MVVVVKCTIEGSGKLMSVAEKLTDADIWFLIF